MRKKITPRFPESLAKLRRAIKLYNNNARLSRLTGISVQTLAKIADGTTRFPWAQTVEALWQVLEEPIVAVTESKPTPPLRSSGNLSKPVSSRSKRSRGTVRLKRFQVRVGRPF